MAQSHIDRLITDYTEGMQPDELPITLASIGIDEQQVLALPENFVFVDPALYDPWLDVPSWATTVGVHVQGSQACICTDVHDGALACWLLTA